MTDLTQADLDRFRSQRQALYEAVADAANQLHAANGCSYCRPRSYDDWRPHQTASFSYEDVRFEESSFVLEIRDSYDDRETKHFMELSDSLLIDRSAFAAALARAQAEYEAAERKSSDAASAKLVARERDERATLRRLAQRYPEELASDQVD